MREIATNPQQKKNSEYAFHFQKPDAHKTLTAEGLARWVTDPAAKPRYIEAFNKSDFESMLNYYKANYPQPDAPPPPADVAFPKVKVPVLMFHGLEDQALLPGALNGTWQWVEKDLTLVTIPGAGHFVQQDAAPMVERHDGRLARAAPEVAARGARMKKLLIGVGVLVVAAARAAFLNRDPIGMMIAFGRLKPERSFRRGSQPAAPDYADAQLGRSAGSAGRLPTSCRAVTCRISRRARRSTCSSCIPLRSSAPPTGIRRSTMPTRIRSPTCS